MLEAAEFNFYSNYLLVSWDLFNAALSHSLVFIRIESETLLVTGDLFLSTERLALNKTDLKLSFLKDDLFLSTEPCLSVKTD